MSPRGMLPMGGHRGMVDDFDGEGGGGIIFTDGIATGATQLSTLNSTDLTEGTHAWVSSVGGEFRLQESALTVDGITVVAADGKTGFQWVRMLQANPDWAAVTSWNVNTATGNDENAGTVAAPLKTVSEVARRMEAAQLNGTFVTISVTGNMAATDLPYFTFRCIAGGFVLVEGVPTALYTGAVTTFTASTPAPSTDDDELHDAGITGGSFTAAGLMANGVLGQTTSGQTVEFWFAKDLGAQTARISKPFTGSADGALANGQSYHGLQLPTGRQMRFSEQAGECVEVSNFLFLAGTQWLDPCVFFECCAFVSINAGPLVFINCEFINSGTILGAVQTTLGAGISSGLWRGTNGRLTVIASVAWLTSNTVTFQSYAILGQQGTSFVFQGDLRFYDYTSVAGIAPLAVSYWSFATWASGAFAGNGNLAIAFADRFSQLAHLANPNWVAGSSTSATPITVSGTGSMSVATEAAGGGNVNAQQNGIFLTS